VAASWWIMLGSLAAAILLGVLAESRRFQPPNRLGPALCWGFLLCCYGVCVGLVSGVLAYFLHVDDWLAIAIAVPVAMPVLWLLAKMIDS